MADDLGFKRLIYEDLGVAEYWVVDVQKVQVVAFAVANGGGSRITQSQVLPHLEIALLEAALQCSRTTDLTQVGTWLLTEIQTFSS